MVWVRLPNVNLCSGVGTKCNDILAWHHCNTIVLVHGQSPDILHDTTVTILWSPIPNADTSAKCIIIVHDNICGTKCYNNDWSNSSDSAKYNSR